MAKRTSLADRMKKGLDITETLNKKGQGADIFFENTEVNVSDSNINNTDNNTNNDSSINKTINDINNNSSNVNKDRNISNDNKGNIKGNNDGNIADNANITVVLKRPPQKEKVKRVSYYLKISTIKFIEDLAKQRGTGISETLQDLMDELQGKIKIE